MGAGRFKILVAERNPLVAEAIRDVFLDMADDHQVTIAHSLAATSILAQRTAPDLIAVDTWLGGYSLEDTVRQLKECSPRARIIVTSSHVDADLERRVLRAGGMGCIEKEQILGEAAGIIEELGAGR